MTKAEINPQSKAKILENLGKSLQTLRDENPEVFFDRGLVRKVLGERVFNHQLERLHELPEDATLDSVFALFRQESSRQEFMAFYVVYWKEACSN